MPHEANKTQNEQKEAVGLKRRRLSAVEGYLPEVLQGKPSEVQERAHRQALERPPLRLCNGKTDRQ